MSEPDWQKLLANVQKRYSELTSDSRRKNFLEHLKNLGDWEGDTGEYHPSRPVRFPEKATLAYAICHPSCGTEELIVDGSTQECQRCGRLMFRVEQREYVRL